MRSWFIPCLLLAALWPVLLLAQPPDLQQLTGIDRIAALGVDVTTKGEPAIVQAHQVALWKEGKWLSLPLPVQSAKLHVDYFRAFSATNIWLFYRPHPNIYYTKILHWDGRGWHAVPALQPYEIKAVFFLDSLRFLAGGNWGGLIYFDGRSTHRVSAGAFTGLYQLVAFSPSHFVATLRFKQDEPKQIFEFLNGAWQRFVPEPFCYAERFFWHLFSPDSGLWVDRKRLELWQFTSGEFRKTGDISPPEKISFFEIFGDEMLLRGIRSFYGYDIQQNRLSKIFSPHGLPVSRIIPLHKKEYFIATETGDFFYLGARKMGKPYRSLSPVRFSQMNFITGTENSGHLTVGLYASRRNRLGLYFVNPEASNAFYWIDNPPLGLSRNLILRTGLIRHPSHRSAPAWDGGIFFADADNDGDLDALLTPLRGRARLFENVGDRFVDLTARAGLNLSGRIQQAHWLDLDGDGWLDLLATEEVGFPHIFRNRGFFRFEEITDRFPFTDWPRGTQIALADADGDGDFDWFLYGHANPIRYLKNVGRDSTSRLPVLQDVSADSPELTENPFFNTQCMAFGDYDNDGDQDLFLANRVTPLALFENDGRGNFQEVSGERGIHLSGLFYSAQWGDLNLDGYLDLVVSRIGSNMVYWNQQGNSFLLDSLCLSNPEQLTYTTGLLLFDLDEDGDLDIVEANYLLGRSKIWRNEVNAPRFIKVQFSSVQNRWGLGARVWLYEETENGPVLAGYRELQGTTGYACSTLPVALFAAQPGRTYRVKAELPGGETLQKGGLRAGNSYRLKAAQTVATRLQAAGNRLRAFALHPGKQHIFWRILFWFLLTILFACIIYLRFTWPTELTTLYLAMCSSTYLLASYFFAPRTEPLQLLAPVYLTLIFALPVAYLFQRIHRLRWDALGIEHLYHNLRQFEHDRPGMKQIDLLIGLCTNWPGNETVLQDPLRKNTVFFLENTLPLLKRIFQAAYPLGIANGSPRRSFRLLKQVARDCQVIGTQKSRPPSRFLAQRLKEKLQILKKRVNHIKLETEAKIATPLLPALHKVMSHYAELGNWTIKNKSTRKHILVIIPQWRLEQVLCNLVDNALQAMQGSPEKCLQFRIEDTGEERVSIFLTDSGPGIAPQRAETIFEIGYSSSDSKGLGLHHARSLVREFGGDLRLVAPAPGSGATFEICLRVFDKKQPSQHKTSPLLESNFSNSNRGGSEVR